MYQNDLEHIEAIVGALLSGLSRDAVGPIRQDVEAIGRGPEAKVCDVYLAESVVYCRESSRRQVYVLMMAALGGPCCQSVVELIMRNDPTDAVRLAAVYAARDVGAEPYRGSLLWLAVNDVNSNVRAAAGLTLVDLLDESDIY